MAEIYQSDSKEYPGENTEVTRDELAVEIKRRLYSRMLDRPEVYPSDDNWSFMISNRISRDLCPKLYRKFLVSTLTDESQISGYHKIAIRRFPEYLRAIERPLAVETVYSDIESNPSATAKLICDCDLFDAVTLTRILHTDNLPARKFVASVLDAFQPSYSASDLDDMRGLLEYIDDLSPLGDIVDKKSWLGSDKKYICPLGHANDVENIFCTAPGCGLDIYGFTEIDRKAVENLREKVSALSALLGED